MRKSKEETAQTRDAIVSAASKHLRETGLSGASVADIMSAAGLTHGGFYRHFENKDQLVCEALASAGRASLDSMQKSMANGGLDAVAEHYLSAQHRDAVPPRCPYAALGSELARAPDETRASVADAIATFVAVIQNDGKRSHEDAAADVATMVGALILSRVTAGSSLSDAFLDGAKKRLRTLPV